ncbi:energy transducer TonB [Rhodopirellula sp. MGV]|uniref:energy transducer TonB n=1 Tax=Rhodopirellula sp. MGV TaxID=2023130 RepID=UPI00117B20A1|nr:energy transducer TonB [Rhodopirellula sp. MGV]
MDQHCPASGGLKIGPVRQVATAVPKVEVVRDCNHPATARSRFLRPALIASTLLHLSGLAAAACWSTPDQPWVLDVKRGDSSAIVITATPVVSSESAVTLPPVEEVLQEIDEPMETEPDPRLDAESIEPPKPQQSPLEMPQLQQDATQPEVAFQPAMPPVERVELERVELERVELERVEFDKPAKPMEQIPAKRPVKKRRLRPVTPPAVQPPTIVPNEAASGAKIDTPPQMHEDNAPPLYPESARAAGYEGRVLLRVKLDERGVVIDVQVDTSSDYPSLDREAVAAVKKWKFSPARSGDIAQASEITVPIKFSLRGD